MLKAVAEKVCSRYDAFPVLAIHDELVLECDAGQANEISKVLSEVMVEAGSQVQKRTPVIVETKVGSTWGSLK